MTDIQLDRQMMNIDVALGPLLVDEEKLLTGSSVFFYILDKNRFYTRLGFKILVFDADGGSAL